MKFQLTFFSVSIFEHTHVYFTIDSLPSRTLSITNYEFVLSTGRNVHLNKKKITVCKQWYSKYGRLSRYAIVFKLF